LSTVARMSGTASSRSSRRALSRTAESGVAAYQGRHN
jgi:hypothetical protein